MEPIEGSETSAFKPQTPGKYPKENLLHNMYYFTILGFNFLMGIIIIIIIIMSNWNHFNITQTIP